MYAIESSGLTKIYNGKRRTQKITALNSLDLQIDNGIIYGLLGPNGAGKTTFVKIILGIVNPTSGSAKLLGKNITDHEVRNKIGFLPENHKFPHYLSAEEVLKYFAKLRRFDSKNINSEIEKVLDKVKLSKWKKTRIKKFSKGMLQRLGLANAIITNPEILFLDEPTDGVDPIGRKEIKDLLLELKQNGKTVFINSHLLSEVESISDRVAILNKGNLIREGKVDDLITSKKNYIISCSEFIEDNIEILRANFQFTVNENFQINLKVDSTAELNSFMDKLRQHQIIINSINQQKSSLEDYFIKAIGDSDKI
ncbi:MAG: ABC transporter ATP-binding protein [Bacteroidetes bacterium]|nr:ABC transporter ATP-binding protein [Bacteroidota bacterium]MBU2507845.1 ABC transporter ATP-binding protein [Bacteroidota bacterium]